MPALSRRSLITGLISFAAVAPAIVRAGSLMPVKVMAPEIPVTVGSYLERMTLLYDVIRVPEESDSALRQRFVTMMNATSACSGRLIRG